MSDINIVYYTYINIHTNYMIIINGQLDDLINSEILKHYCYLLSKYRKKNYR